MNYQALKDMLIREHYRSGWGCLLTFKDDFLNFIPEWGELCLDVGCNVGFLASLVGEERYVGLDIVRYEQTPTQFVVADGHKIPFKDEVFDFVSMIETLEHLQDPYCCLKEARRVLKPKGRLFIQSVHGNDFCAERDPTHFQSFHAWSLKRLLHRVFPNSIVDVQHRGGSLIARVVRA
jgi:ubiquinone/menaquinone biosynthesis C-methylase UbiE